MYEIHEIQRIDESRDARVNYVMDAGRESSIGIHLSAALQGRKYADLEVRCPVSQFPCGVQGGTGLAFDGWLTRFVLRNSQAIGNGLSDYGSHRLFRYSAFMAVLRLQPYRELPLSFAGVASTAAKGDVFPGNYFFIIDDVFPARCGFSGNFCERKSDTTIYACFISGANFLFKPGRDIPVIRHNGVFYRQKS